MPYQGKIEILAAQRKQTGQAMMLELLHRHRNDFGAVAGELRVHPRTVERYVERHFECIYQPKPDTIDAEIISQPQ